MKIKDIAIIATALVATACEKEIHIDYRNIDPLYVVEGQYNSISNELKINKTVDMNAPISSAPSVSGAKIVLTRNSGEEFTFDESSEVAGSYQLKELPQLTPGESYSLSIEVDSNTFECSNTIMQPLPIASAMVIEQTMAEGMDMLMFHAQVADITGERNYFRYSLIVNDKAFITSNMSDTGLDGKMLDIMFPLLRADSPMAQMDPDGALPVVKEGDEIVLQVQSIDRTTYDYLAGLASSATTGCNPLHFFSNNCLGFYSLSVDTKSVTVFREEDIIKF